MDILSFIKVTQEVLVFFFNNTTFLEDDTVMLIKLFCSLCDIVLPVVNLPHTAVRVRSNKREEAEQRNDHTDGFL